MIERPIVLPTPEFFPDKYDESDFAVRLMLERVCHYMQINPRFVTHESSGDIDRFLFINNHGAVSQAAGLYYEQGFKTRILLHQTQLEVPMHLVGTLAHELAHRLLLGDKRIERDAYDHELLTDLTTVFFGMGLFLANAARGWPSQSDCWPDSNVARPEYMTMPMHAYALAHLAWFRNERKPAWASHLNHHIRPAFRQSLRFLWKTGDSRFKPPHLAC